MQSGGDGSESAATRRRKEFSIAGENIRWQWFSAPNEAVHFAQTKINFGIVPPSRRLHNFQDFGGFH